MRCLVVCLPVLALCGCSPSVKPVKPASPPPMTAQRHPGPPVGGGGIAPMGTPALGGLTPVGNSDSVEGAGGGGVGQAAKNQARKAASGAGGSNSTALPSDN